MLLRREVRPVPTHPSVGAAQAPTSGPQLWGLGLTCPSSSLSFLLSMLALPVGPHWRKRLTWEWNFAQLRKWVPGGGRWGEAAWPKPAKTVGDQSPCPQFVNGETEAQCTELGPEG